MNATAAVLYDVKKPVVVESVELLDPGPHEVRVRYAANGVCHSDYHVIHGDYPHPLPVVLGHEASGVVEAVGPGVESVKVGDHVCSSYIPSCGKCWYCANGRPTLCALRDKPRWFLLDGTTRLRKNGQPLHHFLGVAGYATHGVLMEESVIPVRRDVPLDVACLVSCGVLAGAGPVLNAAKVPAGASVAVFGCGGVGLNTIQAARLVGAGKVIAVDLSRKKLGWAEEFGATHVVDASSEDPVARVVEIAGRGGVGLRFEVVGTQKTVSRPSPRRIGAAWRWSWECPSGTRLSIDPPCSCSSASSPAPRWGRPSAARVPLLLDLFMDSKYKLVELISRRCRSPSSTRPSSSCSRGK